jgi:hypothetical protein
MAKEYDIRVTARIEIGGVFTVMDQDDQKAAIDGAIAELRHSGELSDIEVERCIWLDPNPDA